MVINTEPERDVIKSFKKRKIVTNILYYPVMIGIVLAVFSLSHQDPTLTGLPSSVEIGIGLGIAIVALVASLLLWRCPVCNKFFGFSRKIKTCSKCKTVFQGEDKNND